MIRRIALTVLAFVVLAGLTVGVSLIAPERRPASAAVELPRTSSVTCGVAGEVFDPQVHEAIAQLPMPGTEQPTVLDVVERGYRLGEVELRPAKVAVAVPTDG